MGIEISCGSNSVLSNSSDPGLLSDATIVDTIVRPRRISLELIAWDRRERVGREMVGAVRRRAPIPSAA